MIERDPALPWPSIPLNESLRSLRLEECTGFYAAIRVPPGAAQEATPEGFSPWIYDGAAEIRAYGQQCARAGFNQTVSRDVAMLSFGVLVIPTEESWRLEGGNTRYVLDVVVNDPEIGAFMQGLGFDVVVGDFRIEETSPTGAPGIMDWAVEYAGGSLSFQYDSNAPLHHDGVAPAHDYFGDRIYARIATQVIFDSSELAAPSMLMMDGPLRTAQVLAATAVPWLVFHSNPHDTIHIVEEELFYA